MNKTKPPVSRPKQAHMNQGDFFVAFINHLTALRQEINFLHQQVYEQGYEIMALSDQITQLEEAQAKLAQDVINVQTYATSVKAQVDELTALVAELQANGATPENLARLQAVTDAIHAADAAFDAVAPDPVAEAAARAKMTGASKSDGSKYSDKSQYPKSTK